jgi:DNA repair photolyase
MKVNEIKCKTALSKSNLPGLDYSLNPYRGCNHNCAYCYVPNVLRIKRKEWGTFVNVKTNIPIVLSKELKNKKRGIVGISTVTDPYQPIERKYRLTRYCLEQLLIHDFPICIQTKSDLILRDIDIIKKFSDSEVMVSIGTLNDSERKILEPNCSSIKSRLNVLKIFSNSGIKTSVFFGPIYPTIRIDEIPSIINNLIITGISEIMIDKINIKPGIIDNLKSILKDHPELYQSFIRNINDPSYYQNIRKEIKKQSNKVKIRDAFQ